MDGPIEILAATRGHRPTRILASELREALDAAHRGQALHAPKLFHQPTLSPTTTALLDTTEPESAAASFTPFYPLCASLSPSPYPPLSTYPLTHKLSFSLFLLSCSTWPLELALKLFFLSREGARWRVWVWEDVSLPFAT